MRIFPNILFLATILFFVGMIYSSRPASDSLRLVQVFFRHGARTPEVEHLYPNDPHNNDGSFEPMGYGQLTERGKAMAFKLGQVLRKKYDKFLGDIYIPDMIQANSTDFDRTKMSVLLVLAGLFPPAASQKFTDLNWLPIPYHYQPNYFDTTLKRPNPYCPIYFKELQEALNSKDAVTFLKMHKETFDYISNHTEKPMKTLGDIFGIFQTLTAEKNMNLSLPEWTEKVFPEPIRQIAVKQCELENSNDILKRLNGGRSLQFAIRHMLDKSEEIPEMENRKIYLYSGHENNVLNVLAALNLYSPHFPNYSSAVILELHYLEAQNMYAVKIIYVRDVESPPEDLKLEGCSTMCPLNKFLKITENHVPDNYTAECGASYNLD